MSNKNKKTQYNKYYVKEQKPETSIDEIIDSVEVLPESEDHMVSAELVKENPIGKVCKCSKLNVRERPLIDSPVICLINKDEEVEITKEFNNWIEILTKDGISGYCMSDYIEVK